MAHFSITFDGVCPSLIKLIVIVIVMLTPITHLCFAFACFVVLCFILLFREVSDIIGVLFTNQIMNESEEELLFFETFSHDNSEVSLFSKQLNDYIHAVHEEDCELFVRIRIQNSAANISMYMLRAIDRSALSIDRAAPSRDLLLAQASIDGATVDGSRCAIDG